jgi:hypothetical protein
MDRKTFTFRGKTYSYIDNMPDGDYTVGRGADPRGIVPVEPNKLPKLRRAAAPDDLAAKQQSRIKQP